MGNIEIKTREEKKQREKAYYEEAPQIGGRRPSRIRQQINRGMTVFVIVAACILFYFALLRLGHISDVIFKIIDVLKPVLYGCYCISLKSDCKKGRCIFDSQASGTHEKAGEG